MDKPGEAERKKMIISHGGQKGMYMKMSREEAKERGAYMLGHDEVVAYHRSNIDKHKSKADVFWLAYGRLANIVATNVTGVIVLQHFRRKFNVTKYGLGFTAITTLFVPSCMTLLLAEMNTNKRLLAPSCPSCLEVRSGIIQVAVALLYPCVTAPITTVYLARKYNTGHTPMTPQKNFSPNFLHAIKTTTPKNVDVALLLIAANFAVGYFVTYMQGREFDGVIVKEATAKGRAFIESAEQ